MAKLDDTGMNENATKSSSKSPEFMREALDRFEESTSSSLYSILRDRAVSDYKFAMMPGHQWDTYMTGKRRKRPCYEFNRIRQMIRRITGQQLQNRPQIKVRPTEDGDVDGAEIRQGLIRNIEVTSHAKLAYDNAFTWACAGGIGAWEIGMEYEDEEVYGNEETDEGSGEKRKPIKPSAFNKCLKIKTVDDPFCIVFDWAARDFFRRDARFAFKSKLIPRETFKRLYPNKQMVDFETTKSSKYDREWWYEDSVRIAKYWYKKIEKRVIYRLNDGTVVDAVEFDPIAPEAERAGLTIDEVREIDRAVIYSCLISGKEKLTEPKEWPGKFIPLVINWGEFFTVEDEQYYSGMTRYGRDAQQIHNFELSTLVEVVAKMPNAPLTATPKMIEGLQSYYERLGYDDPPVLPYNVDPASPQARPTREPPANFPAAFANIATLAIDELKATTGVYDASLGARSNETSGRAILARQQEADVSNYVFIDNHSKALTYTGEILVDLIPKVYDATRSIRILGEDGAEKYIEVNRPIVDEETGETKIINDLTAGKYDVAVTVGKSFETQRMEVAEAAEALSNSPGPDGLLARYLLLKNLDVPGMDDLLKGFRRVLVQQGLLEPGDGEPPPEPQQPNPKDVADAELKAAQAEKTRAQTQQIVVKTPAEVEKMRAETAESLTRTFDAMPDVPIGARTLDRAYNGFQQLQGRGTLQ